MSEAVFDSTLSPIPNTFLLCMESILIQGGHLPFAQMQHSDGQQSLFDWICHFSHFYMRYCVPDDNKFLLLATKRAILQFALLQFVLFL